MATRGIWLIVREDKGLRAKDHRSVKYKRMIQKREGVYEKKQFTTDCL